MLSIRVKNSINVYVDNSTIICMFVHNQKIAYMSVTYKFKVSIDIKTKSGSSQTIYPIIEAANNNEAKRIAEAQYPQGRVFTVSKV